MAGSKEYRYSFIIEGDDEKATKALRKVKEEIEKVDDAQKKNSKTTEYLTGVVDKAEKGLKKYASVAGGALVAGTMLFVKATINANDELSKMAKRIGIAVEDLVGLEHAAKLNDVSMEQLSAGVRQLSRNMQDAANGNGAAKDTFKDLGIEVVDVNGKLRSSTDILGDLSDRFAVMPDGPEKTATAMRLLGDSGAQLIPMLNDGKDAMARLVAEGQRLNPITSDLAAQSERFNDNLTRVFGSLKSVGLALANDAIPHLTKWSDWLLHTVDHTTWLAEKTAAYNQQLKEQLGLLNEMDIFQVARNVQAAFEEVQKLESAVVIKEAFLRAGWMPGYKKELEELRLELATAQEVHENYARRLAELRAGAQPVVRVTEEMARAHAAEAKQLQMTAGYVKMMDDAVRQSAEAYFEYLEASGIVFPEVNKSLDEFNRMIDEAMARAPELSAAHQQATRQMIEDYRDLRNDLSDIFQDILGDWTNAADVIEKIAKRTALSIAGDFAAAATLDLLGGNPTGQGFSLAGSLANAGTAGKILTASVDKFLPGLAGTLGIGKAGQEAKMAADIAGYLEMMGVGAPVATTSGAAGLLGGIGGAIKAGGSALMSGIGALATNPITWAVLGAGVLAKKFDNGGTPSWNAGFFTEQTRMNSSAWNSFQVDPFESGFAPIGFTRRADRADAEQIIEVFRAVDSAIVAMARNAGLTVSAGKIKGLNESLLPGTTGTVYGAGGEKGKPGLDVQVQLDMFAAQIIESLRGQVSDSDLARILNAGGVEQMLQAMDEILVATHQATLAAADLQRSLIDRYMGDEERLERAHQQIDAVFDMLNLAIPETREEILELVRSLDPLTEQGQAAILAINSLGDAFRVTMDAAERAAAAQQGLVAATEELVAVIENRTILTADDRTRLANEERTRAANSFGSALDNINRYLGLISGQHSDYASREQDLLRRRFSLFQQLQSYTTSLRLGSLSTLNPLEQLNLAQQQWQSLSGTALNLDLGMEQRITAAEQMQSAADAYLEAARKYYASGSDYKSVFDSVLQGLEAAKFLGTNQDPALTELQTLNDSVAGLPADIAAALAPLMQSLIDVALGDMGQWSSGSLMSREQLANLIRDLGPDAVAAASGVLDVDRYATTDDAIRSAYERYGRAAGGLTSFASAMIGKGVQGARVAQALGMSDLEFQLLLAQHGIPAFASGGQHRGGLRIVGERGPELEFTGPARILSNADTRALLTGGDPRVEAKLDRLIALTERLVQIDLAKGDWDGVLMREQTGVLKSIEGKLEAKRRIGSDAYTA